MKEGKPQDIVERTFQFALRIVKLCRYLDLRPGVGRTVSRQLLRSGTSIGANVEEARAGQSKADFVSKNSISLKEARETRYWLRLAAAAHIVPPSRLTGLQKEAEEIGLILGAIVVSARRK